METEEVNAVDLATSVSFKQVEAVAKKWMVKFMAHCLYYYFSNDRRDEFKTTIDVLQAMTDAFDPAVINGLRKPLNVCQFLSRILNGKETDGFFEDESISPLESALLIWQVIRDEQESEDDVVYNEIHNLLAVQAVAVYMEQGKFKHASEVLDRISGKHDLEESFKMKLSLIVSKKDTFHQLILNFSYQRLIEKVKMFVNSIMEKRRPDFLLMAATSTVTSLKQKRLSAQTSEENESCTSSEKENKLESNDGPPETFQSSTKKGRMPKRRLFTMQQLCKNESTSGSSLCQENKDLKERPLYFRLEKRVIKHNSQIKESKKRRPWKYEEDQHLIAGVKHFGVGHWTKILQHYSFKGRTGVMLKDRWRTLKKNMIVYTDE
ncbi:telomeric repeat-binding factor 1 isoform X2 [Erpetoichthys calabaricus]|uniref:telomeric repeat-binding factor 1 isoform X2 n=1 Tax=Erpetoichthys calabaricus TaxID=27687 RepID=UPI002234569A|nr:telomeric repeat-binding factor 1 isoform X2 [Erpetoichthys calabaricus]